MSLALMPGLLFAWQIESEIKITTGGSWNSPAWSPRGDYFCAIDGSGRLVLFDAEGKVVKTKESAGFENPKWSPDGAYIAASFASKKRPLAIVSFPELGAEYKSLGVYDTAWFSDSKTIYYYHWQKRPHDVLSKIMDVSVGSSGENDYFDLIKDRNALKSFTCSPKEQKVAFIQINAGDNRFLYVADISAGEKKSIASGLQGETLSWSPEGKFIWTGAELVNMETKEVISEGLPKTQGTRWSADGKMIYYSKERVKDNIIIDGELACFDFASGKEETISTSGFSESFASYASDLKSCAAVDAKDGNLVLIKFK